MERLYHGNVFTTETSLPRKRLYHGNVSTTGTSLPRERLYHENISTTETSLPRERLYHENISTTETSLPRKRLYHGNVSTTVNLTFWDAPSRVFSIFLKIDNINNRGVMGFDGDELDRKTRTITSFISGN